MKKSIAFVICIIMTFLTLTTAFGCSGECTESSNNDNHISDSNSAEHNTKAFDIADYSDCIAKFPSDKVLGTVDSEATAKEKAYEVWRELYGDSIEEKKPYTVLFDEASNTWLVKGNLSEGRIGGVPYILIEKSDGKVLAVWHSK